ncbi:unnamed protein product [Heligmosomoides polygyrus]|uniref:C-type lectin domain-containing protein n=1 Tax=Heligmosomoides polygyrus TaxID=6339 RepID=A0A183G392_HELPZ|nr:unnamed protein product [Heligmosomoides polygyrus]
MGAIQSSICRRGWMQFKDSCYYFEEKPMNFKNAEARCLRRGGTLFVAETVEEWDEVPLHAPLYEWVWIGLSQRDGQPRPDWGHPGGISLDKVDWLRIPHTVEENGWNSAVKCVANLNSRIKRFAFFYYCELKFLSICERNATLIRLQRLDE